MVPVLYMPQHDAQIWEQLKVQIKSSKTKLLQIIYVNLKIRFFR